MLPIDARSVPEMGAIARGRQADAPDAGIASAATVGISQHVESVPNAETTGGDSDAANPQVVAISRDHYFASRSNHSPRTNVGWSTTSSASETRQHFVQASDSERGSRHANAENPGRTDRYVVHSPSTDTSREVTDLLVSTPIAAITFGTMQSMLDWFVSTVSAGTPQLQVVYTPPVDFRGGYRSSRLE